MKWFLIVTFLSFSFFAESFNSKKNNPKKTIEELTKKYFEFWSNAKMEEYGNLFHSKAVIYYRDRFTQDVSSENLETFLRNQTQAQLNPQTRMTEIPLNIQVELAGEDTAMVTVYWKLSAGYRTIFGYDHFIWAKLGEDWKIISLFFYNIN